MTHSNNSEDNTRCGFVALVGRANVGKSTLLNALLGSKVAIVTPKPQTTRTRILGMTTRDAAQIVWVDTPGVSQGKSALVGALRKTASHAAADADVNVLVVHVRGSAPEFDEADEAVFATVRRAPGKCVVAINKVDAMPSKEALLPWMAALSAQFADTPVVPISARTGEGLPELVDTVVQLLPPGPMLYPADQHTDQAERTLCAEMVREQVLLQTQQEVPHGAVVTIESFEDSRDDAERPMCRIDAQIHVERTSHKPIVIGRGGRQIKAIGQAARRQIERMLGCQVFLGLTVHVDPRWTANAQALQRYGITAQVSS
jgi:GTP-binding protein Era